MMRIYASLPFSAGVTRKTSIAGQTMSRANENQRSL
jgi:hypothetical protein